MGEKKKVIYILGPLDSERGLNDYMAVDAALTCLGYETISQVSLPEGLAETDAHFIAAAMINAADAVVVLPNWQTSKDAVAENHLAYGFCKDMVYIPETYDRSTSLAFMAQLKDDLDQVLWEVSA